MGYKWYILLGQTGDEMKFAIRQLIKKFIKYGIIGTPLYVIAAVADISGMHYISEIIIYLYLFYVLFDIGWSITSTSARKKYIIYMSIIIMQIVVLSTLGEVFGFKTYISSETENSLLDAISVFIIFGTITGILIKIVHDCKKEYPAVRLLYFPISMMVLGLISIWFRI